MIVAVTGSYHEYFMTHMRGAVTGSQLLHSHYLQSMGRESLNTSTWLICSLPTSLKQEVDTSLYEGNIVITCIQVKSSGRYLFPVGEGRDWRKF